MDWNNSEKQWFTRLCEKKTLVIEERISDYQTAIQRKTTTNEEGAEIGSSWSEQRKRATEAPTGPRPQLHKLRWPHHWKTRQ